MTIEKVIVLIMIGDYLPGYKGGGPTRSIANLVDLLSDAVKFKIITSDRDFGESDPYSEILYNGWNKVGKADVMYLSPSKSLPDSILEGFFVICRYFSVLSVLSTIISSSISCKCFFLSGTCSLRSLANCMNSGVSLIEGFFFFFFIIE